MFEVGKDYRFRIIEGSSEVTFVGTVEKYEHPLLKLADVEPSEFSPYRLYGQIINVTSPSFISAERQDLS